jgi:murein DD-endopeptidase MepM/ murein hydrolase activator NlpD
VSTGDKGITVHLVHQSGQWGTLYSHLESVIVKRGAKVGVGQAIGTWGYDPSNETVRHLHFQCGPWNKGVAEFAWADPKPLLARAASPVTVQVKPPRVVS